MKHKKYILSRLFLVFLAFGIAGLLHEFFIYPDIKKSEGWLQGLAERQLNKHPDVLYFSSSPNKACAPQDVDRRFISQMVQDSIYLKLEPIDTGAIHAGIFYSILQKIPKDKYPKVLVVNLNIRSHGNNWIHSNLENSLQRNMVYWNNRPGIINHLLASCKYYDYKTPMEHLRAIEHAEKFGELPFTGSHRTIKKWCDSLFRASDNPDEGMTMIRHFGFKIDANNIQLKHYELIAEWAKKRNIPLIFVLLPENVERMRELVGQDLHTLVGKNAQFLNTHFTKKGVTVINLWNAAGKDVFFEAFPTEHYSSVGRSKVASEIARTINEMKR